jgi:hypothetical protein
MLPTKFRFIWPSGFREEDFLKSAHQKQELPVVAMFMGFFLMEIHLKKDKGVKQCPYIQA